MTMQIQQSTTADPLFFYLTSSTDHISPLTGLGSGAVVTISKNGGAFSGPTGAISEIANGWYQVAGNATDTGTLGAIMLHATGTGADPFDALVAQVVVYNPRNANLGLSNVAANVAQWNGTNVASPATAGIPDVNAKNLGGTAQTGRDVGASVLLSSGTGTGQLSITSGVVQASLVQILGTALTETAGQIAAAFKQWFNVATPTGTVNSIPNATAGAAGGLFIAGTNAATSVTTGLTAHIIGTVDTVTTLTNLPAIPANWLTAAGINTGALNGKGDWLLASSYTAPSNLTAAQIATGVWQDTTAGDFTTAASIGKSLFTSGNAPGAASGLALVGSNMGTVSSVTGAVGSVTGAVGSVTAGVTVTTNNDKTGYTLSQSFPTNFAALAIGASGHITNVDTLTTYTGNTPQTGDAFARLGAPAGASVSADVAALKTDLDAGVNVASINGSSSAAQTQQKVLGCIPRGTCTSGGSTTSVPTSAFSPSATASGQFIGRTLIFDDTTSTPALQGQATTITASSGVSTPTLTVVALTTAPSAGDTFSIL